METFNYLLEKGRVTRYNHKKDAGITLPRPVEYFPSDIYRWEIKIHRPDPHLVGMFIRLDIKRQKERREPEQFGYKEYPQDHGYYA